MCMFYKSSMFSLFGLVILNLSSSQSSSSSVFICLEAIHLVKASLLSVTLQCSLSHHQSNTLCCIVLHCVTLCYIHSATLCFTVLPFNAASLTISPILCQSALCLCTMMYLVHWVSALWCITVHWGNAQCSCALRRGWSVLYLGPASPLQPSRQTLLLYTCFNTFHPNEVVCRRIEVEIHNVQWEMIMWWCVYFVAFTRRLWRSLDDSSIMTCCCSKVHISIFHFDSNVTQIFIHRKQWCNLQLWQNGL